MQNQTNQTNGMAIAGMVLGIASIVFSWIPFVNIFALIAGIVGLILSVMGRKHCTPGQNGMVIAGLVLSIIGIVISGICTTCYMCTYCAPLCAAKSTVDSINSLYYY